MRRVEELNAFHGKVEQKCTWSRGLFVSYSGFSEQGLIAVGKGKRIICLDGVDLSEHIAASCRVTWSWSARCDMPPRLASLSSGCATYFSSGQNGMSSMLIHDPENVARFRANSGRAVLRPS